MYCPNNHDNLQGYNNNNKKREPKVLYYTHVEATRSDVCFFYFLRPPPPRPPPPPPPRPPLVCFPLLVLFFFFWLLLVVVVGGACWGAGAKEMTICMPCGTLNPFSVMAVTAALTIILILFVGRIHASLTIDFAFDIHGRWLSSSLCSMNTATSIHLGGASRSLASGGTIGARRLASGRFGWLRALATTFNHVI